jgi:uncharacterized protein with NAD-binding domain and iron-sulfur cluster
MLRHKSTTSNTKHSSSQMETVGASFFLVVGKLSLFIRVACFNSERLALSSEMKGRSLNCFVHAVILTASHLYANAFTTAIFGRASAGPRSVLTNLREQTATNSEIAVDKKRKTRIVVVGGGWAGYSFCESISTNNINDGEDVEIILLDASKQARGGLAGGYRDGSSNNRPVEAGIHGFWREYRNTFEIMKDIDGVDVDQVLGDFTPSALYSKNGKVAVAPVLLEDDDITHENLKPPALTDLSVKSIRRFIASNLPSPLDLPVLAELDNSQKSNGDSKLKLIDLISGLGLLGAWSDFEQESPTSWKNYDDQPASALFEKAGITDALYDELVSPLLHVLPMCPAYDCSAAAALSCFHVFALQSRGAFDVRWCRGSISEKIFEPWQEQLEKRGVVVRGGARVQNISTNDDENKFKYTMRLDSMGGNENMGENGNDIIECDAVVMAVGATSAGKLVASSPAISNLYATKDFDKLRGVTCVAVRLFLKPHETVTSNLNGGLHDKTQLPPDYANAMFDSPIAVCGADIGGIEELKETGFCIYDLQRMHDEFSVDEYHGNVEQSDQVAVLEVDFYRADAIVDMDNQKITDLALEAVAAALGTSKIEHSEIVDSKVVRARNAVSHFAPKSALYSPDIKLDEGLYVCGDWVDRTGHASWSTEKSVVTARQAASAFSQDFGLKSSKCQVIPAAKDTPQLNALRQSARLLRSVLPPKTVPPSPWVFVKQLLSGDKEP